MAMREDIHNVGGYRICAHARPFLYTATLGSGDVVMVAASRAAGCGLVSTGIVQNVVRYPLAEMKQIPIYNSRVSRKAIKNWDTIFMSSLVDG